MHKSHNKPTKHALIAKSAINAGLVPRCSTRRLWGRYVHMKTFSITAFCALAVACTPYYKAVVKNQSEYKISVIESRSRNNAQMMGEVIEPGTSKTVTWDEKCVYISINYGLLALKTAENIQTSYAEHGRKMLLEVEFDGDHFYYVLPSGGKREIATDFNCKST